jgi:hypothetical protein
MDVNDYASRPGRFFLGESASGTYSIRSWMSPRSGLDAGHFLMLPGIEPRFPEDLPSKLVVILGSSY